jgi:hypothetical protein
MAANEHHIFSWVTAIRKRLVGVVGVVVAGKQAAISDLSLKVPGQHNKTQQHGMPPHPVTQKAVTASFVSELKDQSTAACWKTLLVEVSCVTASILNHG